MSDSKPGLTEALAGIIKAAAGEDYSVIHETGLGLAQVQNRHSGIKKQIFVVLTSHKPHDRYSDSGIIMVSNYTIYIKADENTRGLVFRITEALQENRSFIADCGGSDTLCYIVDEGGSYEMDNELWYVWKAGVLS